MALAAAVAPQPSSLAEPSWDETIVPTLRQRLQQESRALTKRLSQHSIISGDESQAQRRPSLGTRAGYGRSATDLLDRALSPNLQRPSAIPRPSMQYDRQQPPQSAKKPVVTRPPQQRPRTQSTPYRYDPADPNPADAPLKPPLPNGMPTPASSRAASPFNINGVGSTPARPSRIPMVTATTAPTRQRSGSNSSHGNSSTGHGGGGKPNGRPPPSPEASLDLFPVMESGVPPSLAGKPRPPRDQPQIRDETPPYDSAAQARASVDSLGERPVQHWYRGDTSRNGGVGEIKVVNRKEMLEIATFGHQPSPQRPLSGGGSALMAKHRRAGSMEGNRGSWLMDDQAIALTRSVMEEAPLTDLEDGTDVEASSTGHQQHQQQLQQQQQQEQQREPVPQRPAPVAAAPTTTTTTKPAPVPMTPKKAPATRPQATPQSKVTTPSASTSSRAAQQKRGKPKPTPQKKKTTPATPAKAEPLKEETEYGDEYSIPYTPQPPSRVGNWDDVVLPAVSKRMGIEGLGVKSEDGIIALPKATPKPSRESMHYEPAPGTFGYDASKAQKRDPREQGDITEFGGISPKKPEPVPEGSPMATPTPSPRRPIRRLPSNLDDRPPSPAPFSDYPPIPTSPAATPKGTPRKKRSGEAMPTIMVHPPSPNGHHVEKITVEPEGAGCCKCVIM